MHVLFIYPQFLRTKYILFAFPGGHASVECTHPDTRAELNSTSCFQGIADVAMAQSLRWRKVGGVIIPDDTSLCFCTMLQLQKLKVRTGILLDFISVIVCGSDEPLDARGKDFQGTEKRGSIWTTAALYHHNWEAYTVSAAWMHIPSPHLSAEHL